MKRERENGTHTDKHLSPQKKANTNASRALQLSVSKNIRLPFTVNLPAECQNSITFFDRFYPTRVIEIMRCVNEGSDRKNQIKVEVCLVQRHLGILETHLKRLEASKHPDPKTLKKLHEYLDKYTEMLNLINTISFYKFLCNNKTNNSLLEISLSWLSHYNYPKLVLLTFLNFARSPSAREQLKIELNFHVKLLEAIQAYFSSQQDNMTTREQVLSFEQNRHEIYQCYSLLSSALEILNKTPPDAFESFSNDAEILIQYCPYLYDIESLKTTVLEIGEQLEDEDKPLSQERFDEIAQLIEKLGQELEQIVPAVNNMITLLDNSPSNEATAFFKEITFQNWLSLSVITNELADCKAHVDELYSQFAKKGNDI